MSANKYSICPQCVRNEKSRQQAAEKTAEDAYGKVTSKAYSRLVEDAKPRKLETTLEEYYEIGVDANGRFSVNYAAGCRTCGFDYSYKHEADAMQASKSK